MNRLIRLTAALFFLSATALWGQSGQWTHSYYVGTAPQLTVESNDASISVRCGGKNNIEAHVYTEGYNINRGDNAVTIRDQQNGYRLSLNVHIPQSHWGLHFGNNNHRVRIEVIVPVDTFVSASSGDGAIKLEGLHAGADLRTSDGSVEVTGHQGSLKAHTSDGSITFDGVFDNLDLHSSDGSIHGTVRPGSHLGSAWHLVTSDGSIEVGIPGDLAAQLDLNTGDGRVLVDGFPLNGRVERQHVFAPLNGGGKTLEARSSDGSIHFRRN
jgi:hypothetical protein